MSEDDLKQFKMKVKDLNDLLASLENLPERKTKLESCQNHDEVVELAKSWGFNIGSRWGEKANN